MKDLKAVHPASFIVTEPEDEKIGRICILQAICEGEGIFAEALAGLKERKKKKEDKGRSHLIYYLRFCG